jgi:phosphomevalonate kinase
MIVNTKLESVSKTGFGVSIITIITLFCRKEERERVREGNDDI